jgi:hypothetical protein
MRYLYQQLLAFCGMVALILLIVGVSFTQLTKQTIEETIISNCLDMLNQLKRQRKPMPIHFRSLVKIRHFKMHCC